MGRHKKANPCIKNGKIGSKNNIFSPFLKPAQISASFDDQALANEKVSKANKY